MMGNDAWERMLKHGGSMIGYASPYHFLNGVERALIRRDQVTGTRARAVLLYMTACDANCIVGEDGHD